MTMRDKRGRIIGRNWWREYNCELLHLATLTWEDQCEAYTKGYDTEREEYRREHPVPNLKHFLIHNKGMNQERR